MNPTDAMRWILCLCQPFLRLSHAKTLRDLVVAGFTLDRADLPPFIGPVFMRGFHASELHYPLAFAV